MGQQRTPNKNSKKKKVSKSKDNLRSLWNNIKCNNIHITEVTEGEERAQGIENLLEEIMMENSPNLVKEIDIQTQEAQKVPNKMNPKRPTPRHIIIKIPKFKDRENLKNIQKNQS